MPALGWLTRPQADVPAGEEWLGFRERRVLADLTIAPRRASWLLGRWTAKQALAAALDLDPAAVEVLAADDGAPEAWSATQRIPVSVSISHRAGRALAVVGEPAGVVDQAVVAGCDLELVEPRSEAFLREWLSDAEQRFVRARSQADRELAANLIWTAKEAAAKVRRAGLRLDLRRAAVLLERELEGELDASGEWHQLEVLWSDGHAPTAGWWRAEPGWVMSVAAEPAVGPPVELTPPARS